MNWKKIIKGTLKGIGILFVLIILLIVGAEAYISYQISDKKLAENIQKIISTTLGTEVKLGSASLKLFSSSLELYNLSIYDQQKTEMLHVDTLRTTVALRPLLQNRILVRDFYLYGAKGNFYQETENSVPNYQFAVDSLNFIHEKNLKKEKKSKKKINVDLRKVQVLHSGLKWDIRSEEPLNTEEHKELDMNHLWIDDLTLIVRLKGEGKLSTFSGKVQELDVKERNSQTSIELEDLVFNAKKRNLFLQEARFAYQDKRLKITNLACEKKIDAQHLDIEEIFLHTDNGLPPRYVGRPKRGKFDPGHLDLHVALKATATSLKQDSLVLHLDYLQAKDDASGLLIDSLNAHFVKTLKVVDMTNLKFNFWRSRAQINHLKFYLPQYGKEKREASFVVDQLSGRVILQDIAHTFAPDLKNFTTPLYVRATAHGNFKRIDFRNIYAYNNDRRVEAHADGYMILPPPRKSKDEPLGHPTLYFTVHSLNTRNGIKEQILSHFVSFPPRFKEMIVRAGNLTFRGNLVIPFRRLKVDGVLGTRLGDLTAHAYINSDALYLKGSIDGKAINLIPFGASKLVGPISLQANFWLKLLNPNIVQKATMEPGKLPTGYLNGVVREASYSILKIHNIQFKVQNDEKSGSGSFWNEGKLLNISADFTFDDKDISHTLKVKPKIQFLKKSKKDKAEKKEKKKEKKNKKKVKFLGI